MVHEVVRLPRNMAELDSMSKPTMRKVIAMLMDERERTVSSERAHRIAIAALSTRYGHGVLGADQRIHAVSLVVREKDVRALPPTFDVRYVEEAGALRCVVTSPDVFKPEEQPAAAPGQLVVVGG
jgi:hypothetical protein